MKSVKKAGSRPSQVGSLVFSFSTLTIALCALAICLSGCRYPVKALDFADDSLTNLAYLGEGEEFARPGMTEAEARRRDQRVRRLNRQMLMSDIDTVLMLDRPSRLSDKRLP